MKLKSGVFFGYVCPICWKIHPKEEQAVMCMGSHDELEADYIFATGERFPVEVHVYRKLGMERTECATYERVKIEKVNKNDKKEESSKNQS